MGDELTMHWAMTSLVTRRPNSPQVESERSFGEAGGGPERRR